jgi:hypothetical protein
MVEGLEQISMNGGENQARGFVLVRRRLREVTNSGKEAMGECPQQEYMEEEPEWLMMECPRALTFIEAG